MLISLYMQFVIDVNKHKGLLVIEMDTDGRQECGVQYFDPSLPSGTPGKRLEGKTIDDATPGDPLRTFTLEPKSCAKENQMMDHHFLISHWKSSGYVPHVAHRELLLRESGPSSLRDNYGKPISTSPRTWSLHVEGLGFSLVMPEEFNVAWEVMET